MSDVNLSHWEESYISEYFELWIGGTPSRSNETYWDKEKKTDNKWVSIKDIKHRYISNTEEQISDFGIKKSNVKLIPQDTVLMSFKLTIGRLTISKCPLYTNEAIVSFIPKTPNSVDTDYLYYGLQSWNLLGEVDQAVKGATLNKDKLSRIFGLFPPLPEQKKIASILTSVDEVIENTQKQIDKLQDLKKATMNELLTKGIGHTEFRDSELGRIPKSWEVQTLGDMVLKITDGEHLSPNIMSHGKPILSAKDIREDGVHISGAKFVEPITFQKMLSRCNPEFGDVLVVSRGATIGRVTLNNLSNKFALMGSVILIKPVQEKLIGSFISLCLESETTQSEMLGLSGSSAQQAIYLKDIKNLKLPVPRLIEQNKIASLIKSIDDQKKILKSKRVQTQSLKKSLMRDLLTGKVRVQVN